MFVEHMICVCTESVKNIKWKQQSRAIHMSEEGRA